MTMTECDNVFSTERDIHYPVEDWQEPTEDQLLGVDGERSLKYVPLHPEVREKAWNEIKSIVEAAEAHMLELLQAEADINRVKFGVHLSLEELVVNGLHHGNGTNPNKHYWVRWGIQDDTLHVELEDQGAGFDVDSRLNYDPTADENLDNPGGRGFMLVRRFMDYAEWLDDGRRVRIAKVLKQKSS